MSDSDSFIEEVTEEVRRDRLFRFFRRYGWIALVAVVLLVGGAAFNEWRKAQNRAAAEALGDAILTALQTENAADRLAELGSIEAQGPDAAVVGFLIADTALREGDTSAAVAALDKIAANSELPARYRDLATLKRATLQAGSVPADERIAALETLITPGAPYRLLAEEQIALAEIEKGERGAALDRLRRLSDETEASAGLRRRVSELIVVLGGEPGQG